MTGRRRLLFYLTTAAIVVAALEGLSFAGFHVLEWVRSDSVVEISMNRHFRKKVTPQYVTRVKSRFDAELGWVEKPFIEGSRVNKAGVTWSSSFDGLGARKDPYRYDTLIAATFGDSFTKGAEVDNDQTWQSQAASALNSTVLNFGVGGYGILQAVMRAERTLQSGPVAPATILGIFESNLNRSVNAFRPFFYRNTAMSPLFAASQSKLSN